jgi:hypothetical protein
MEVENLVLMITYLWSLRGLGVEAGILSPLIQEGAVEEEEGEEEGEEEEEEEEVVVAGVAKSMEVVVAGVAKSMEVVESTVAAEVRLWKCPQVTQAVVRFRCYLRDLTKIYFSTGYVY